VTDIGSKKGVSAGGSGGEGPYKKVISDIDTALMGFTRTSRDLWSFHFQRWWPVSYQSSDNSL